MADKEDFKFPDEQDTSQVDQSDDIEIEIEDDTPEPDRGRKPLPKDLVEELEKDDLEEYSDKVKKRLSQMKKVWHDERREKERALREREEALKFAQIREQEIRQLKTRIGHNELAFIAEAERAAKTDLSVAKDKLKQAYESGDSEKITEAQEALTDVKLKLQNIERAKPALQKQAEEVKTLQQTQAPAPQPASQSQVDPKAEAWRERNSWFGEDEEMTALALGLHEKLVRAGVDPRSDDYYRRVDETMRRRFPESFEDDDSQSRGKTKLSRNRPATVVAPVTRSTAPRQVRLTPSQVAIAKKLGLSNQEYAKAMIELENNNG
jgi:hypothetical protein